MSCQLIIRWVVFETHIYNMFNKPTMYKSKGLKYNTTQHLLPGLNMHLQLQVINRRRKWKINKIWYNDIIFDLILIDIRFNSLDYHVQWILWKKKREREKVWVVAIALLYLRKTKCVWIVWAKECLIYAFFLWCTLACVLTDWPVSTLFPSSRLLTCYSASWLGFLHCRRP